MPSCRPSACRGLIATYTLEHLAPGSRQFATQILQYIEATKVTSLGVFGVVALLLDLVIVMTNVEKAFNKTWRVSRTRPWSRKVSDYLSIFLIFPILMAVALTLSTSFLGIQHVVQILSGIMPAIFFTATRWLVSLGLLWFAFIFIYLVMVNTKVHFWSAVLGGVVGGTVWQLAQWIFIAIQGGAAYYNAIYGALYNLLFLFIWLFWCWMILLFGTEIAFAHQNLDCLTQERRHPTPPPEPVDEYLCLAALVSIGARFRQRQPPLSLDELSRDTTPRQQPSSSGYPGAPGLQFGSGGYPGPAEVLPPVPAQTAPGSGHGQRSAGLPAGGSGHDPGIRAPPGEASATPVGGLLSLRLAGPHRSEPGGVFY